MQPTCDRLRRRTHRRPSRAAGPKLLRRVHERQRLTLDSRGHAHVPLGDIGVALVGAFCLWAAFKAQNVYLANPAVWYGRTLYKMFFLLGTVFLILSLWNLVTWKGAI